MKRLITLLAACLLGLGQAYAQDGVFIAEDDYSAKDYYENYSRAWYSEINLEIWTMDYFKFGHFPEYKVRLDYFLCEALTHKVLSIETKTVSVKADDFSKHSILLKAPAGQVIRNDIHYDFQTKVNGKFETRFGGFQAARFHFCPMLWRNGDLYVSQSEVERFCFDNIPGEAYKKLNDPKLPTKAFFYVDEDGNAFVYNDDKNDLPKNMGNYANADGVDRPSMKDGFWPKKVNGYHVKHNMVFKLKYNDGQTLPSNLKLYLFMESPLYDRNGNLRRIADCTHGGIELVLSSQSGKPWVQGTFEMDNDERLFAYPVWQVVAKDLNTGESHAIDWGLLDMHIMSSDNTYAFNVIGTIKNGDLLKSIKNGDLKVDRGK